MRTQTAPAVGPALTLNYVRDLAECACASIDGEPLRETRLGNWNCPLAHRMGQLHGSPLPRTAQIRAFMHGYNWRGPSGKADDYPPTLRPWFVAGHGI